MFLCFQVSQFFQVLFILFYIQIQMGFISIALILFQPVLFYCILSISQKLQVVWICSGMSLGLIAYFKHITGNNTYQNLFYINEYDLFLLTLSLSWMCLKCNSYYLSEYKPRFLDFLATVFTCLQFLLAHLSHMKITEESMWALNVFHSTKDWKGFSTIFYTAYFVLDLGMFVYILYISMQQHIIHR